MRLLTVAKNAPGVHAWTNEQLDEEFKVEDRPQLIAIAADNGLIYVFGAADYAGQLGN